ncbi:S66 peptidase family protein [Bernardetia sp.]|uniref:S66 peptidase family protein n=1 Tax=Bernardetia sp. TaxID=1937974 RepID=UPI0025BB6146|nr:LD-carboxypeptidase [Bernardetia sp.]
MQSPPFLKKNDTIHLIAPSGIVEPQHIEQAVNWIIENGFIPQVGTHLTDNYFRFAATDKHRLFDLQKSLDSDEAKAIWCIRGGYGMGRILDDINWEKFIKNPKWLIGFSDITAIHLKINQLGFQSMHGVMPVQFKYLVENEKNLVSALKEDIIKRDNTQPIIQSQEITNITQSLKSFLDAIKGKSYKINADFCPENRLGQAEGEIIGGNLSMIINSLATPTEIDTNNKILFLEEVGENLYAIDRMLWQLYRAGKFKHLKGLVIGSFSGSKQTVEQFGFSVPQMITELVKDYHYPVAFGFPIGHTAENQTVMCGATVSFQVNEEKSALNFFLLH